MVEKYQQSMMSLLEASITELSPVEKKYWCKHIKEPWLLKFISDNYKALEIHKRVVEEKGWILSFVPDQHKTQ